MGLKKLSPDNGGMRIAEEVQLTLGNGVYEIDS
jgi:hypothetical protein